MTTDEQQRQQKHQTGPPWLHLCSSDVNNEDDIHSSIVLKPCHRCVRIGRSSSGLQSHPQNSLISYRLCYMHSELISTSLSKSLLLFLLLLNLLSTTITTKQLELNGHNVQMLHLQPYQTQSQVHPHHNQQQKKQHQPTLGAYTSQVSSPAITSSLLTQLQAQPSMYKPQILTRLHRNISNRHHETNQRGNPSTGNNRRPQHHQETTNGNTNSNNNNINNINNKLPNLKFADGIESSPSSMNSMLGHHYDQQQYYHHHHHQQLRPQLILAAENYNPIGGGGLPASSAATVNGIAENPATAAMLGSNLIDSLDMVDDHGVGASGNYDYTYQQAPMLARDHQQLFPSSGISSTMNGTQSSTMALYRLLNLIDQSQAISMPFQSSKTSLQQQPPPPPTTMGMPISQQTFDNYSFNQNKSFIGHQPYTNNNNNNNENINNINTNHQHQHLNNQQQNMSNYYQRHHQPLASHQTSSIPADYWSSARKQRNHHQHQTLYNNHWRQAPMSHQSYQMAHQLADTTYNNNNNNLNNNDDDDVHGPASPTPSAPVKLHHQQEFVDNAIEVQPVALKMIKSSSGYSNTPPRHRNNQSSTNGNQNYNNRYNGGGGGGGSSGGIGLNLSSSSQAIYGANGNNNNNHNNLNNLSGKDENQLLMMKTFDGGELAGFGSKQPKEQPQRESIGNNISEKLNGGTTLTSLSSSSNSKVPHDADSEMIAANNAPRCDKFTPDICVDDFEYPEQAIIDEIQKKRDVFELMYSEVKDNEPLVDGIPREVEESYNYDYYYYGKTNLSQAASQQPTSYAGQPQPQQLTASGGGGGGGSGVAGSRLFSPGNRFSSSSSSRQSVPYSAAAGAADSGVSSLDDLDGPSTIARSASTSSSSSSSTSGGSNGIDGMDALIGATPQATNNQPSTKSPPENGFICPSEVMYGKPKLAKNKKGAWKVIVNAGDFTQTVRLEKCLSPNKRCNFVSAPNYDSRCAQVHSYHRLLVFEKGRGFYIDTFRLPTGCNCHVTRKAFVAASSSSAQLANNNRRDQTSALDGPASRQPLPALIDSTANLAGNTGASPQPYYQFGGRTNSGGGGGGGGASTAMAGNQYHHNGMGNGGPNERSSSESMLSQTLWSILSGGTSGGGGGGMSLSTSMSSSPSTSQLHSSLGGGGGGTGVGDTPMGAQYGPSASGLPFDKPGQREAYQSQSLIIEHLSQNPGLAANISDSVLRQLIDVGQISGGGGLGGSSLDRQATAMGAGRSGSGGGGGSNSHYHYQMATSGTTMTSSTAAATATTTTSANGNSNNKQTNSNRVDMNDGQDNGQTTTATSAGGGGGVPCTSGACVRKYIGHNGKSNGDGIGIGDLGIGGAGVGHTPPPELVV